MKKSQSGTALLLTLGLMCITATLLGAVFTITSAEARFMRRSTARLQALAYADGVLETLYDQWRIASSNIKDGGTAGTEYRSMGMTYSIMQSGLSTNTPAIAPFVTAPSASVLPVPLNATLLGAFVAPVTFNSTASNIPAGEMVAAVNMTNGTITAPMSAALLGTSGWSIVSSTTSVQPAIDNGTPSRLRGRVCYVAEAAVSYMNGVGTTSTSTVTVKRVFTRAGQNIFDNFLYSSQPVTEIDPGALMTITGPVYAGGVLYTPTSNLVFNSPVTSTGGDVTGYSPTDPRTGQSTPTAPSYPTNSPPAQGSSQSLLGIPTSSLDPNYLDGVIYNDKPSTGNTNSNNEGFHEIIEMQTQPLTTNPDPFQTSQSNGQGNSERLANNADWRITIDVNNNVTIYNGALPANAATNTTPLAANDPTFGSGQSNSSQNVYATIMGAITTNTTLDDQRVGDNVRVVNVDVSKIAAAVNATTTGTTSTWDVVGSGGPTAAGASGGSGTPDGILLYIQDTSAGTSVTTNGLSSYTTTTNSAGNVTTVAPKTGASPLTSSSARGIRLVNGGVLPNVGLTVASPNPVYIQGDYNTGTKTTYEGSTNSTGSALTASNTPPSNGASAYPSNTSDPTEIASGYPSASSSTKPSAVVAADAVTILSNSWADANSAGSISARIPSNTTVNAAIVAGNVPSYAGTPVAAGSNPFTPPASDAYSGGIENFPRLLENWGGYNLTIHGSFALLYDSEQAWQPWPGTGTVYNAANRRWFYDPILQSSNPPGFPAAYQYTRGPWIPHS